MKRVRALVVLALACLAMGLASCNRNIISEDLPQKWQVIERDANHSYDLFSKYFLNHDPDDPYLD